MTVVGVAYGADFNADKSVWGNLKDHPVRFALVGLASWLAYAAVIEALFRVIDAAGAHAAVAAPEPRVLDWLTYAAVIFLAWLPLLIVCYPCSSLGFDYFWQLLQGTGVFPLSQHHPVLGSLVYGALYRAGHAVFGTANGGLFLTALFQACAMASSLALGLAMLKWLSCPRPVRGVLLAFLALNPVLSGHAVWLIKDSVFSSLATLLFMQCFWRLCVSSGRACGAWFSSMPAIAATAVLFSLYRNGVMPIAALLFVVLLAHEWRSGVRRGAASAACGLAALVVATQGWGMWVEAAGAYPTNAREALTLPSRQIVNTIRLHPTCLTADDEAFLTEVYRGWGPTLEGVVKRYDYRSADSIKTGYFEDGVQVGEYLRIWVRLGLAHPGSYLDAALQGTYGYWWLLYDPHEVFHATPFYDPGNDFGSDQMRTRSLRTGFNPAVKSLEAAGLPMDMSYGEYVGSQDAAVAELFTVHSEFPHARELVAASVGALKDVPALSCLLVPGFYTVVLLFAFTYLASRRKTGALLFPLLLIVAMACLSPVNAYMRYVLPAVMLAPLVLGTCFIPPSPSPRKSHFCDPCIP